MVAGDGIEKGEIRWGIGGRQRNWWVWETLLVGSLITSDLLVA